MLKPCVCSEGSLPAVCYFNLLDVAQEAGDEVAARRVNERIRELGAGNANALSGLVFLK